VSGIHAVTLRTNTTVPEAVRVWTSGSPRHRSGMDSRHSPLLSVAHEAGNDDFYRPNRRKRGLLRCRPSTEWVPVSLPFAEPVLGLAKGKTRELRKQTGVTRVAVTARFPAIASMLPENRNDG
jgi:hypothetical protein